MDTALPQKFPFILDRNLAKANCTGNHVCTSCDTVVLGCDICLSFVQMRRFLLTSDTSDFLLLRFLQEKILLIVHKR